MKTEPSRRRRSRLGLQTVHRAVAAGWLDDDQFADRRAALVERLAELVSGPHRTTREALGVCRVVLCMDRADQALNQAGVSPLPGRRRRRRRARPAGGSHPG